MRITGKVALVTGASGGIGRAVAVDLGAAGAKVIAHGRDEGRLRLVADASGGTPLAGDLESPDERRRLAERALDVHGRIDILVNNAGVGWSGRFTDMTNEELRRVVTVDLLAQLELTHALLPGMVRSGTGHICFVSSVAGRTGVAGEAAYAAAKAGLDMFAESLRAEAAGTGVRVSVVVPGVVRTGFFEARGRPYDRRRPRPVSAERVAAAIVDGIAKDRDETWVPGWLRIAPIVRVMAPGSYRRLTVRFGEQQRLGNDEMGYEAP